MAKCQMAAEPHFICYYNGTELLPRQKSILGAQAAKSIIF